MTPEDFRRINKWVTNLIIPTFKAELERLKSTLHLLESSLEQHKLFQELCGYLVGGETMAGYFGCSPTYGMFVRKYRADLKKDVTWRYVDLIEVDLVIIPDLLVEHVLRVNIPNPTSPGVSTNSPEKVGVSDIVKRMQKHTGNAKNVSIGTFADVMCEECTKCRGQALVVAIDKYLDDDNGREFTVNRFCENCALVEPVAFYSGKYEQNAPQYRFTDGIYR